MRQHFLLAMIGLSLCPALTQAAPCTDLKTCAKVMFDVTQERYIWDVQAENHKFSSSPDVEINKDNADLVFTALLDQTGLARMPVGDGKSYRIVERVLLKEIETPIIDASAEHSPSFPHTWDWVTLRYKSKFPESLSHFERSYRLHVPREARMQADSNTGVLIVTASIPIVRQMYELIKAADRPLSALAKKEMKEMEERDRMFQHRQMMNHEGPPHHKEKKED